MPDITFSAADIEHAFEIHALYQSLVGTPFCSWVEEYPDLEMVFQDILRNRTYIARDARERIIAAVAVGEEEQDEPDTGDFGWTLYMALPCFVSRLGVAESEQGKGIASALMRYALNRAEGYGFDGARLLVTHENLAARAIYAKFGFEERGSVEMYGESFVCMERLLI